jgi:hypothetical protein
LMFAVPQVTKTADLNMARIMKRSTSNRGFSAIPATFKLKENKQGPNLHLTETSHPTLFRNLCMHSRLLSFASSRVSEIAIEIHQHVLKH